MKNKIILISCFVIILLIGIFFFLKMHPPLRLLTISYSKVNNPHTIVVHIENQGHFDIKVNDVLVNNNETPKKVKLGLSRTGRPVMISDVRDSSEGISFRKINAIPIKPHSKNNKSVPYAIIIYHSEEIRSVTVKYSYLGIPYKEKLSFIDSY